MVQKYIFLDMDGVLATNYSIVAHQRGMLPTHINPAALQMLNDLCRGHDARIVSISTWAKGISHAVKPEMKEAGFSGEFAEDWRIDNVDDDRSGAITRYCRKHGISAKDMIILDDENSRIPYTPLQRLRLIQPNGYNGLLLMDYLRADAKLANRRLTAQEQAIIAASERTGRIK